jgi:hypothetical protein
MNVLRTPRPASQRRSWSIAASVTLTMAVVLLTGCHVRLIGDYDDTIDKGISDIQQRAELYFSKLQSNPNTPYDQSFYDDIRSRLATLRTRASASFKKEILVQQISELQKQFNDFQLLDQGAPRPIPASIVTPAESAINVSVESILKLELALRRGAPAPPPPAGAKN